MMTNSALLMLISLCISATTINAQTCSNAGLEYFVELEQNATIEARNEILSVALGGVGGSAVEGTTEALYSTISTSLNITVDQTSDDQLNNFTQALDVITDSYFKACYSPLEERPSPSDTPQLITELLTLLNNETNYDRIRQLYGQLLCLQESTNTTDSARVSKRQVNPECFDAIDLNSLYNCIDPNSLSCIFQFEFCPDSSPAGGQSEFIPPALTRNCLAFVVDTTGSMGDEIVATRQVIADFIAGEQNINTACYVLIAYNDFGDTTNLENNLEFARVYTADSLKNDSGLIEVEDGQQVFGLTKLLQDVNGLTANGGADCPEYGMIGIQKAIDLIRGIQIVGDDFSANFLLRRHNIVVLTDASAKDDYLASSIIMNLQEFLPSTEVHFFFSGSGCSPEGFGNFPNISAATNGITVQQIDANAFQDFVDFIQLGAERFTKRRRRSDTCRSFVISQFISEFTVLARTDQNSVAIVSPNGTSTALNTADRDFVIHTVSAPDAGTWQACVTAPGTLETSLATTVDLEFTVDYLTEDSNGQLLPSINLPFICSSKSFTIEIARLHLISFNHSLFLDFVDQDRNILSSAEITDCRGTLSGTMSNITSQSIVKYQLRGRDSLGNEFSHERSNLGVVSLQNPENGLSISFSDVIISPNELSTVRLLVTNRLSQPYQDVDFQLHVPSAVNISLLSQTKYDMLLPQETISIPFGLTTGLSEGSSFDIILSINDYCIITNVTIPALVRPFVHVTVVNRTVDSITFSWIQPEYGNISKYIISYETSTSNMITTVTVDNSTFMYTIDNLRPYEQVFVSVIAKTIDDLTVAGSFSQPFRAEESAPSSIENLQIDVTSSTSARLSWSEPTDKNGIILYYEVTVTSSDDSYSRTFTINATISNPELALTLSDLREFARYEVTVTAATIAGKSEPLIRQFYTSEGVPSSGPSTIRLNVITNNMVQIAWDPPVVDRRHGFIIGYSIELLAHSNDATTEAIEVFTVGANTFVYELPMLDPYRRYEVVIRARTSAGLGQRNSTIFYVQEGAPLSSASSVNFTSISATSFLLTWKAPDVTQRRGFLTRYTVLVSSRDSSKRSTHDEKTYTVSHETTELLIEDLERFGAYSVSVSAATSAGTGPTITIQVDIATGVPSAPTNASVEQINSTAVALQWGNPREENGRIEEFVVAYSYRESGQEDGTYTNKSTIQVPAPSNGSVVTDLVPGKRYMFEIAARNPAGIGDATTVYISLVSETSVTGSNSAAIAASVSVVLVVIIVVCVAVIVAIAIFLTFRQKQKIEKVRNSDIPLPEKVDINA